MAKLPALALALSLDSFLVCTALGTLDIGRAAKRNLILLFAMCDGIASLMGGVLSARFAGVGLQWLCKFQAVALCLYLLVVVFFANYARIVSINRRTAAIFYALPLLLCVDNLVTGLSLSQSSVPFSIFPLIVALANALMAFLGLRVGLLASRHLPASIATLAGVGLMGFVAAMPLR